MLEEFTVNARQYYDFAKIHEDNENVDSFFDQISETCSTGVVRKSLKEEMKLNVDGDENGHGDGDNTVFYSPMNTEIGSGAIVQSTRLRRSLSAGNVVLEEENQPVQQIRLEFNNLKLTKCGSTNSLNNQHISRERLNRLAQPKETIVKSNNFISMAEAVLKFHKSTPKRFRSVENNIEHSSNTKLTKPQTPKLLTKNRTRPVYALSREEQEKQELDEAKKFKIKAHPVSTRVLKPPMKAFLPKKSATVPEPFKLSHNPIKKVVRQETPDKVEFRAKPVPKAVYQPFEIKPSSTNLTNPSTPKCLKKHTPKTEKNSTPPKPKTEEVPLKKTQPAPFSFEKRDEELKKKKEELIKKTLEDEKKAREFHAKPVPKYIKHTNSSNSLHSKSSNKDSIEDIPQQSTFKARPATVLKMKPFETIKIPHVINTEEFHLSTERRLKERHEFDLKQQEKEKRLMEEKLKEEQQRLEYEEQLKMQLRKQAEFKAQPVHKYKPVEVKPSGQVTEPVSPKFHYKQKNKENMQCN